MLQTPVLVPGAVSLKVNFQPSTGIVVSALSFLYGMDMPSRVAIGIPPEKLESLKGVTRTRHTFTVLPNKLEGIVLLAPTVEAKGPFIN